MFARIFKSHLRIIDQFHSKINLTQPLLKSKRACSTYSFNPSVNNVHLGKYIASLYEKSKTCADEKLLPIANILDQRSTLVHQLHELKALLIDKDQEISQMAQQENDELISSVKSLDEDLMEEILLYHASDEHTPSMMLEVNAGVGGQEAMLFAGELFDMYLRYLEYRGWQHQVAEELHTDLGGIRHGSVLIDHPAAFGYLQLEAGVHRVQRVPATEKSGRTHTSTVSVLALPQPSNIEIVLPPKDLRIETKRATGAGGQHVNTTDSAVRIVHLPTGMSVECQTDRSQLRNKETALQRLRTKLYEAQRAVQIESTEATKRSQVRTNYRNEKIRTYNFPQDRITDHRLSSGGTVHNVKGFFEGGESLERLMEKLLEEQQVESLICAVTEFEKIKK